MRPLVVDLGRDYRGGQHQALLLLQGLRARGHAPELLTVRDSSLARACAKRGDPGAHASSERWRTILARHS